MTNAFVARAGVALHAAPAPAAASDAPPPPPLCGALEQHHAAVATALLTAPRPDAPAGILGSLPPATRARVLHRVTALIAATDLEQHNVHMSDLESLLRRLRSDVASGAAPDAHAALTAACASSESSARATLCAAVLKTADLSNAAKPWRIAARWAGLLKAEHLLLGAHAREGVWGAEAVQRFVHVRFWCGFSGSGC